MTVRYIFNTSGEYVAFVEDDNLFNRQGDWLGFIENGNEVYNLDGVFIGYVLGDDRIVRDKRVTAPKITLRHMRPMTPLAPLPPLRRLKMPPLPYPYEDVFESIRGSVNRLPLMHNPPRFDYLLGAWLTASDGTFLGLISRDRFDTKSITNPSGEYGSPYSQLSIFNEYGPYGGRYGLMSPFNPYSTDPPKVLRNRTMLGHLTTNEFISDRIDANEFVTWLNKL